MPYDLLANKMSKKFTRQRILGAIKHYGFYLLLPALSLIFFTLIFLNKLINLQVAVSDNGRIGGVLPLFWYLSSKDFQKHKHLLFVFFDPSLGKPSNSQWDKMVKSRVRSFNSPLFYHYIQRLIKIFGGLGKSLIFNLPSNVFHSSDIINPLLAQTEPCFSLTEAEILLGEKLLLNQGIDENDKIFCFHNRDSAYLKLMKPDLDWSYHDYRDSKIENYLAAADYFIKKGFYSIRVGSVVEEKIPSSKKKLIDYANSTWRSDFLDVYLSHRCSLFLCSDTGISVVPEIFHKPMVYVNWTLLPRMTNWVQFAVFIPKKIFHKKLQRYLSFKEIINNPELITAKNSISWNDLDMIENTSEEILEACIEMDKRMNGEWIDRDEDLILQEQFWSLYPSNYVRSKNVFIGTDFLKQNKSLLQPQDRSS